MTGSAEQTIGELSEAEILERIFSVLKGSSAALVGPGDDAAVLAIPGGRAVVTTDTLVHGPDFRLAWSSGGDLGFKAAAVNLADVAAMGATPTALFVALAMPEDIGIGFVEDLAAGLRLACDELAPGCAVEGGDLTVSDTLTVAITAVGVLAENAEPVLRSGARPGDTVAVAGPLGSAGRGLALLFSRFRDDDGAPLPVDRRTLTPRELTDLDAQLRPRPPVALGAAAAAGGATAMMDVSDGLVLDARRMAVASGVTISFEGQWDAVALTGGEDHALLATFPADAALPAGFRRVGHVREWDEAAVQVGGSAHEGRGGWDPYRDWDSHTG